MDWVAIATGPSLTQEDVDAVRGLNVIAVSDAYRMAPWADCLHSSDERWWKANPMAMQFPGLKSALELVKGVTRFHASTEILEDRPGYLATGRNSGYQAINLAIHYGARRILLLGFDMKKVNSRTHFFGSHPPSLERAHPYGVWWQHFGKLAAVLEGRGIEVINCTPGSALTCFRKARLADALQELRRTSEATEEAC